MASKRVALGTATLTLAASCAGWSLSAPMRLVRSALPLAGKCTLPLVHDIYDGFQVGVPAGWDLSTMGGQIAVDPSPASPEGTILYSALLTKKVTAASVFSAFMRFEQALVRKSGNQFSYRLQSATSVAPSATVQAQFHGVKLSGKATVTVLPLKTQLASSEALVSFAFGPKAKFASEMPTLTAVGRCYQPARATLFALLHQPPVAPFTFIEPPGWHIGAESQDDLSLDNAAGTASATFDLWGPFVSGVNISQPINNTTDAIKYWFRQLGLQGAQVLSATLNSGGTTEYLEFTATLKGAPVHGLIYMNVSIDNGSAAGVFRLALSASSLWNSLNGALIEMAGSIQHDFTQDLQEIQTVNRQWQDFSGQVADFDDTLNNQQLVQDPSTGKLYEAPYSSYGDGPQGPGYYGPNGQLLNPVQRA